MGLGNSDCQVRVLRLYRAGANCLALEVSEGVAMAVFSLKRFVSRFPRGRCPQCGHPVRQLHCDVCGYDVIAQTRDKALRTR
jgi:hypothetical protein